MSQPMQPPYGEKSAQGAQGAQSAQSAHSHGNKWNNGLFDCFSPFDTCFMGCCCPCLLFGKTQARERGEADPSMFNANCCGWYCLESLGHWAWVIQFMKRGDMRARFGIEGNGCGDCMAAWCCQCCALIQEEKESLLRTAGIDAKTGQQYQAPAGMTYQ